MQADDELCLCFHVTRRKVEQFLRARRPPVASQLSECFGAGTGCGWCRPFLKRLHHSIVEAGSDGEMGQSESGPVETEPLPSDPVRYAAARSEFRRRKGIGNSEG